jgi:cytochrome c553
MHPNGSWMTRAVMLALSLAPFGMVAGCQKAEPTTPPRIPEPPPVPVKLEPGLMAPPIARPMGSGMGGMMGAQGMGAGRTLFTVYCARCHTVTGGKLPTPADDLTPPKGPDLLRVAADPEHTLEWLIEQIRDPQAHKAGSTMPRFAGKLRDKEIEALAKYLSAMR